MVALIRGRRCAALLLATIVLASVLPLLLPGAAVHNGGTGLEDSDVAGCHCHNIAPSPNVTLNLMGLPERYEPGAVYDLIITVAGGPPLVETMQNAGGFMVSCTNGTFAVPEGSDLVQVFSDGQSASHTLVGNDYRQWRLLWRAPPEGTGDAVFHLSANTVNGDGVETGELDAYNQFLTVSFGADEPEDVEDAASEWGVPLAAYWMGTIAIVATLVLTWAAYYLIRGTSRHHVVHLGSRSRYVVEERTPPSSFGAAVIILVLTVVEVAATIILVQGILGTASDLALAINLGVILFLFLLIVAIYRSAFVPRLTSIEAEGSGPGARGDRA